MTPCTSSLIEAYQYDDTTSVFTVVLRTNHTAYHYSNVSVETFWEFEASTSKGVFYNTQIKGNILFPSQKGEVVAVVPEVVPPPAMDPDAMTMNLRITEVPAAEPINEYVTPEIMSPDQAVAVISPKNPKADELTTRLHAMAAATATMAVKDKATQTQMEKHLVDMTTVRKVLFDIIDPYRAIAYAAYEQIQKLNKSRLDPVDVALKNGKLAINAYITAEQEKARAEQRRLQAIEDARAEQERQKRTEDLRLQMAQEAQETGDTEQAELILADDTIQAAPMPTYAPRVEMPTSSLPGRKNWTCEVIDMEALVLDVAAGIVCLRKSGKLEGHAPINMIEPSMPNLKKRAKADEIEALFPGVRAWNDSILSTTKMKG